MKSQNNKLKLILNCFLLTTQRFAKNIKRQMHKSGPREQGISTCKFNKDINLEKANDFIKEFIGYAITCCRERAKNFKINDRHVVLSSSLEALYDAFCVLSEKFKVEHAGTGLKLKVIRISCRNCLYHQLIKFGLIPDKKRVYFPTDWVCWEDYFKYESKNISFYKFDVEELIENGIFTETEQLFIDLLLKGFSPTEISQSTGYGVRWVHQAISNISGRLRDVSEVDYEPPYKYGRIGPYKKSNVESCT